MARLGGTVKLIDKNKFSKSSKKKKPDVSGLDITPAPTDLSKGVAFRSEKGRTSGMTVAGETPQQKFFIGSKEKDPKTGKFGREVSRKEYEKITGHPAGKSFLGLSPEEVALLAQQQAGIKAPVTTQGGAVPEYGQVGGVNAKKLLEARQQLEQAGAFNVASEPVREEFGKTSTATEAIFGKSVNEAIWKEAEKRYGKRFTEGAIKVLGIKEDMWNNAPAETKRDLALKAIRQAEYEKGLKLNERLGAILEFTGIQKIDVLGIDIGGIIDSFVQRPREIADSLLSSLEVIDDTIATTRESIAQGTMSPEQGMEIIDRFQESLAKGKARLQLAMNASYKLRKDPEFIDLIETKMFKVEQRLFTARNDVAMEKTRRLTGTGSPTPTDEQMFWHLQQLSK